MTDYHVALFAHFLGLITLYSGVALELAIALRLRAARSVEELRPWAGIYKPLHIMFPSAGVLILASGLYMMVKLWTLDTSWVIVGLISFFILGGMGEMINARRITTIADTVSGASDGSLPATLRSQINDPILWTAVFADAAGLLGVIFLMTLKPGLVGSIVTMLIALGVGAAIGQVFVRREVEAPAGARA